MTVDSSLRNFRSFNLSERRLPRNNLSEARDTVLWRTKIRKSRVCLQCGHHMHRGTNICSYCSATNMRKIEFLFLTNPVRLILTIFSIFIIDLIEVYSIFTLLHNGNIEGIWLGELFTPILTPVATLITFREVHALSRHLWMW
jgi:hypothetical protein